MKKMLIGLLTGAFLFSSVAGFSGCAYPPVVEVEYHQHSHPNKRYHRFYYPTEVVIYTSNCVSCHRTYHVHPPNPHHPIIIYNSHNHQHQRPNIIITPKKQVTVTKQKTKEVEKAQKKSEKTQNPKIEKQKTKTVKPIKPKP